MMDTDPQGLLELPAADVELGGHVDEVVGDQAGVSGQSFFHHAERRRQVVALIVTPERPEHEALAL